MFGLFNWMSARTKSKRKSRKIASGKPSSLVGSSGRHSHLSINSGRADTAALYGDANASVSEGGGGESAAQSSCGSGGFGGGGGFSGGGFSGE